MPSGGSKREQIQLHLLDFGCHDSFMADEHIPVNRRERVSQRGWRLKDWRLIKLAEPEEWKSIRDTSDWHGAF